MNLRFARTALDAATAHAEEGFPHEVTGVLAGRRATWTVSEVVALINERSDSAHNRYKVSGLALQKAERAIEQRGLEVVGYYHSHPDHPSQYSDYDRDHAWPNMAYPIFSVMAGQVGAIQGWRLRDDRSAMDEIQIEIIEES